MVSAELERMMKLQDVILKAIAKRNTWMAAAEIAGVSDRTMRRIKQRYEEFGYDGLFDQRRGKRSIHRIPLEIVEQVLSLYQEKYFDFSVLHFHEKLRTVHRSPGEPLVNTAACGTTGADTLPASSAPSQSTGLSGANSQVPLLWSEKGMDCGGPEVGTAPQAPTSGWPTMEFVLQSTGHLA
jgi:hypothetical protein